MSDDLRDYVNERAKRGGFSTPSEYVRHLICEDRTREAERELERLLLEGLEGGESKALRRSDWQQIRATVRRRAASRLGNGRKAKAS